MATIIRLKRRRNEDPLEVFYLANKRRRNALNETSSDEEKSVFKFAGTVSSKDDGVSKHVREAIRREKLERQFKQHQVDIVGDIRRDARAYTSKKSQNSRFRVTSKYRAVGLDDLDTVSDGNIDVNNTETEDKAAGITKCDNCSAQREHGVKSNKDFNCDCLTDVASQSGNLKPTCKNIQSQRNGSENSKRGDIGSVKPGEDKSDKHNCDSQQQAGKQTNEVVDGDSTERMFNLVDIVSDTVQEHQPFNTGSEQITCNAQPMEREVVSERSNNDEYVYDIYYTNREHFDFRLFERDLTLEALGQDNVFDQGVQEEEFVYGDDDDDENDENNWRNDYPEEDPQYVNGNHGNYDYENDLDEYLAFETETGNQLADWMSWRCNIDGTDLSSDEDALDIYGKQEPSSEVYCHTEQRDLSDTD